MITRVANLVLACGTALVTFAAWFQSTVRMEVTAILVTLVVACWLAGAIGLFFGNRLAWYGSLLGVGMMFANSLRMVWAAWRLRSGAPGPTDGSGEMMIVGFFGLLLTSSIVVGLVRLRKALLSTAVATGAQPTRTWFTQIVLPAGLWVVVNILLISLINVGASLFFGLATALWAAVDCSKLQPRGSRALGIPFKPVVVFGVCAFFLWGFGFIWYLIMRYRVRNAPVDLESDSGKVAV